MSETPQSPPVSSPEPEEVPLSGARRWLPAILGGILSLATLLPVFGLLMYAFSSDGRRERIVAFCLFPTILVGWVPRCTQGLFLTVVFTQFFLYGIILSLPTRVRERRRAKFLLLGVHLVLVGVLFSIKGIRK